MVKKERLSFWRKLTRIEKTQYFLLIFFRLTIIIAIVSATINFRWTVLFVSLLALFLTFSPKIFERRFKVDIPIEIEIFAVIFIYAAIFLGEVRGYYTRFWWWDIILHSASALAIGFIGFMILYVLYKGDRIKASPRTIALFTFFFAVGIGAIWEIFEFSMDQIFGLNMQKSGLQDTMWDLIVDSAGALLASFIGYFYIKRGKGFFVDGILEKFVRDNPHLFKD